MFGLLTGKRFGERLGKGNTQFGVPSNQTFEDAWEWQANEWRTRGIETLPGTFGLKSAMSDKLPGDDNILSPDCEGDYKITEIDKNEYEFPTKKVSPK